MWIMGRPAVVPAAVERFMHHTAEDLIWLAQALKHERRRWFVARLVQASGTLPETLCDPMIDAAIDAREESFSPKLFVAPCVQIVGSDRVTEYLRFRSETTHDPYILIGTIRAAYGNVSLGGVAKRRRAFLLDAFVAKDDPYLRNRIRNALKYSFDDETEFSEIPKELLAQAREIARQMDEDRS